MNNNEIMNLSDKYIATTYKRYPITFSNGQGSWLTTIEGEKYLDFFPGWGVSNLGHCPPLVVDNVQKQVASIIHLANVFYMEPQSQLSKKIIDSMFPGRVFFSNSGTESVECAIKAAKAWGNLNKKTQILSFNRSFHGRTMGSVSVTAQKQYQNPFKPLLPDVKHAEFNNIQSLKNNVSDQTAAVLLELIQGEGGIHIASQEFIRELVQLSKQYNFLIIIDEVQTGFGRTGKMFCYEHYDFIPDIVCLGKAIASGIPMGATVFKDHVSRVLQPGMHASTFGGNYIACAASLGVFDTFEKEKILNQMLPQSKTILNFLSNLKNKHSFIKDIRHKGMMFGIELNDEEIGQKIIQQTLKNKLIINLTAKIVLRIMPALNISHEDCTQGLERLEKSINEIK